MTIPQLLNDIISVLLALAIPAAVLSLMLAGISLRRHAGEIGGGFTKWMFWCVVFLTIQQLLGWFSSFGLAVPIPGGSIGTPWLSSFSTDLSNFVNNFVLGRMTTVLAAYLVLRAILDAAAGNNPLLSILAAMFLLGAQGTVALLRSWNDGTEYATADMLASAWTYLASTIMPISAGLAIFWGILNFATHKPWLRMVGVALALLCVTGIWKLVLAMMG